MPSKQGDKYYSYPDNAPRNKQNDGVFTVQNLVIPPTNDPLASVTVIVPIYNAAKTLDQTLNSVQAQTHPNLEILCINDGSTDESLEIIHAHAATDDRIVVIDKKNEGYGATCNRGIEEAHGEWISILEPDDWIEGQMYTDMLNFASQFSENIDIIKTPYWRIINPDTPEQRKTHCTYKYLVQPKKQPFELSDAVALFHHHPSIWSAIYRKSFLDNNNIRFPEIPGAGWADNPFLAETLCQAKNIVYLDQAYYCYRSDTPEQEKTFHRKNPNIPFDRWNDMLDVIERLGITDPAILCAHYSRGFMYMGGVIEEHDPDSPCIHAELERMFGRMDPDLVFAYPYISPGCRRLFAEIRGLPKPRINYPQYAGNLVRKGFHNIRLTGLGATIGIVRNYTQKYSARSGGR